MRASGTHQVGRDTGDAGEHDEQVHPQFFSFNCLFEPLVGHHVVHAEVDAEQQHEHRGNPLGHRCVFRTSGIQYRKTSGSGGSECDAEGIERLHSRKKKQHDVDYGENHVDSIQGRGRIPHSRDHFVHGRSRRFRPQKVKGISLAFVSRRNDGQEEHQHAHSANPVAVGPPEKQSLAQALHIRHHRRSRGGETGNNLEQGIHKSRNSSGQIERQCPDDTQKNPGKSGYQHSLFGVEIHPAPHGAGIHQQGHGAGRRHGADESDNGHLIPRVDGNSQGRCHAPDLDDENPGAHPHHYLIIHPFPLYPPQKYRSAVYSAWIRWIPRLHGLPAGSSCFRPGTRSSGPS